MTLEELNQLGDVAAYTVFESCCVSRKWIKKMILARPFINSFTLLNAADEYWAQMQGDDILQAFEGHPRIGDISTLREKFANTAAQAGHEQSGMNLADGALLQKIKQRNDEYYDKFGYIFIVCASGKSATEMLGILESRLPNDSETELKVAAAEQGKITRIRLEKVLGL
ncbi:MAG: 2-oxo-4-hydroxy-4-carboxy-5-ureidoimidazoline decarboxylase [Reinekea sp.]|jgi:2-oxo-4-hydroxy-4-carboxy-5-ureidoimidazoline decarboxylase